MEEGVSDHCHERMTVKALPGPSLEVVEAEFLLQLLMGLLASHDPFVADRSAKVRFYRIAAVSSDVLKGT